MRKFARRRSKMKWYFACNDRSPQFYPLIKGAVNSAIKNTTLEPNFIYDGSENEFTQWLREKGVNIIFHRSALYDALEKYYDDFALNIASGAFLRCDIPLIENDDEFVLYTDCDVLFLKDFDYENIAKPEYFACSAQFGKKDFVCFNTGVMYMNVRKLKEDIDDFFEFIKHNFKLLKTFDQDAYQIFYNKKNTELPIKYNHKPYWGRDKEATILHFHGPKPTDFENDEKIKKFNMDYCILYNNSPSGYKYYLNVFTEYNPEIGYDKDAIKKLNDGIYPLVKPPKNPLSKRLKNRLKKEFKKLSLKFINKS